MRRLIILMLASLCLACQTGGIELASMDCEKHEKKDDRKQCREALHSSKKTQKTRTKKTKVSHSQTKKKSGRSVTPSKRFFKQAMFHQWNQEPFKAIEFLKKAIEEDADYAAAYYKMGNIYVEVARYQEAIAAYEKAVEKQPKMYEAHYNKAMLLKQMFNYRLALQSLKDAVATKKVFPKAHFQIAAIYETLNEKTNATYHFKKAYDIWHAHVESSPNYFQHRKATERLYLVSKRYLEGVGVIEQKKIDHKMAVSRTPVPGYQEELLGDDLAIDK